MTTVGLLLAAGAGRRMGGPKSLVRLTADGPTLLEVAVARLHEGGLDRVIAVVGAAAEQAVPLAVSVGAEVVVAAGWEEGMGASLRAGLGHLAGPGGDGVDAVLVTLVDLPDVTAAVHRRVLAAAGDAPRAALARATYDGRPGHPVLLGRDHWAGVRGSARGDRGARVHLAGHPATPVECGDLATGADLDTPDALRAASQGKGPGPRRRPTGGPS
ncbi:MAG TPA: nucleotidyltransferase family protein [Phycicoccus sp.]|nr:nucleotidyltransferase family protein [Phycicoccus sp.]